MKHLKKYKIFTEDIDNPNTPQGYLNSLSKKPKLKPNNQPQQKSNDQKPTDEVDDILVDTEQKKNDIIVKKDTIEKGLLNNIRQLEPENQKEVKQQVDDYKKQVVEFDRTVTQIGKLNKTLKDSNVPDKSKSQTQYARVKNRL